MTGQVTAKRYEWLASRATIKTSAALPPALPPPSVNKCATKCAPAAVAPGGRMLARTADTLVARQRPKPSRAKNRVVTPLY